MPDGGVASPGGATSARARILDSAYELFSRHGIRAVGIERILESARVAKMTLYRHFPSKDELGLAFLEERRRRWTQDWLQRAIEDLAPDRPDRVLALFDALDRWFHQPGYEGCSFIRTVHEMPDGPLYERACREMETVRRLLADHAAQAGVDDPEAFAYQMQILMMGAMVSALRGDREAARRARKVAARWLAGDPAVGGRRN